MRVDQCAVAVEPRGPGGIIDLAFVFTRQFAGPILQMLALFAIPSTIALYLIALNSVSVTFWSLILFLALSPFFSAALVASIGPRVFGQPISLRSTLKRVLPRLVPYFFLMLFYRAAIFLGSFCVVLGIPFVPPGGFLAEVMFLEQSPGNKIISRAMSLCGNGGFVWFLLHAFILGLLWLLCSIGVLLAIDLISTFLFSTPIIFQRVVSSPDAGDALLNLLFSDPRSATAIHASVWIPFPIIRLAWFFCYLDHRIRSECWDLEVKYRAEAIRLSESGQNRYSQSGINGNRVVAPEMQQ